MYFYLLLLFYNSKICQKYSKVTKRFIYHRIFVQCQTRRPPVLVVGTDCWWTVWKVEFIFIWWRIFLFTKLIKAALRFFFFLRFSYFVKLCETCETLWKLVKLSSKVSLKFQAIFEKLKFQYPTGGVKRGHDPAGVKPGSTRFDPDPGKTLVLTAVKIVYAMGHWLIRPR